MQRYVLYFTYLQYKGNRYNVSIAAVPFLLFRKLNKPAASHCARYTTFRCIGIVPR